MLRETAVLSVYRHEVPWPDQGKHQLELFAARVTRDVDKRVALVDDFGAPTGRIVHQGPDRPLVPGNDPRRKHHNIPRLEANMTMLVSGDTGKCRTRLTL